ncbi:MAG: hypothetical protein HC767_08195, partial [Akkermansiaceae bacterium]|nr:hypothetical protein [Akkermansiaceae bacterium]
TLTRLDEDANLTIDKIKPDRLTVVKWVRASSKALSEDTIRNCWFKASILGTDKVQQPPPRALRRQIARRGQVPVEAIDNMLSDDEAVEVEEEEVGALQKSCGGTCSIACPKQHPCMWIR